MEPFDVLNMWSILNFNLEHSNHYLFYFWKFQEQFISQTKILSSIGFMVLITTSLNPGFERKNWVEKKCTESWDIDKNVSKFGFLRKFLKFSYVFANISGPDAFFFALKHWVQASRFEYHDNLKIFFRNFKKYKREVQIKMWNIPHVQNIKWFNVFTTHY